MKNTKKKIIYVIVFFLISKQMIFLFLFIYIYINANFDYAEQLSFLLRTLNIMFSHICLTLLFLFPLSYGADTTKQSPKKGLVVPYWPNHKCGDFENFETVGWWYNYHTHQDPRQCNNNRYDQLILHFLFLRNYPNLYSITMKHLQSFATKKYLMRTFCLK